MEPYQPIPRYFNINYPLIVGENCSLSNTLFDCAAQIRIGDDVAFGHDCRCLTGSHDYGYRRAERMVKSINKPINIESGVWIASGVTICQGVTIGNDSVICAGAVVIHDVPSGEMWGGIPAKFIKKI